MTEVYTSQHQAAAHLWDIECQGKMVSYTVTVSVMLDTVVYFFHNQCPEKQLKAINLVMIVVMMM